MSATAEGPRGTVDVALQHAARLLEHDLALAAEQAAEILKIAPGNAQAQMTLGLAFAGQARHAEAADALQHAVDLDPDYGAAWRALGDQRTLLNDDAGADKAYAQSIRAGVNDPALMEAALALCEGRLAIAERQLRAHLYQHPTDVAAIRMLAETAARIGRFEDAEKLLARCLELAPSFRAARHNYAVVLQRQNKVDAALKQIDMLLAEEPQNPSYRFLKAAVLARIGEYQQSIALYKSIVATQPGNHRAWLSLGHARKTAGLQKQSEEAYARAIDASPDFGEAYWSLANMKTYRFTDAAVTAMEAQLARAGLKDEDRFHIHYALGKASEDRRDFARSFDHYAQGARIRRTGLRYDADENHAFTERLRSTFSAELFKRQAGQGCQAPDPIFIVGLPRAGSTLLEQILSSHSAVEGTMELPDIGIIAKEIGGGRLKDGDYPEATADLDTDALRRAGEDYIARTRVQRKTGKPFFIDKLPNNFAHIGLIQLILPRAKIIDARRNPMGCCFSGFKQHFARGQTFTYDLSDLGRYYRDYAELMDHFDAALPGKVHRVLYENVIADPEREVRRALDYLDLPFETACLEFHQNARPVRTASSEQVRQPLYSDAVDHWRAYETWLGPLRDALGPALDDWTAAEEKLWERRGT